MGDILVATDSFVTEIDGEPITVHRGVTRVRAGHALALANPDLFEPISVHFDVEDASADPKRKRGSKPKAEGK